MNHWKLLSSDILLRGKIKFYISKATVFRFFSTCSQNYTTLHCSENVYICWYWRSINIIEIDFHLCFFFFLLLFYFTILYSFYHTATWTHHGCTWVPTPESPSHLPPHTIPLGYLSAPAPSFLYPALNLDWRFISHMILYMFQCHSPKSSCPLPLPQSRKVCSVHLRLFCCLAYRVIITIFLNSIYMC